MHTTVSMAPAAPRVCPKKRLVDEIGGGHHTKQATQGPSFGQVVIDGAGAMGIDIIHVHRGEPGRAARLRP